MQVVIREESTPYEIVVVIFAAEEGMQFQNLTQNNVVPK